MDQGKNLIDNDMEGDRPVSAERVHQKYLVDINIYIIMVYIYCTYIVTDLNHNIHSLALSRSVTYTQISEHQKASLEH